MYVGVDLDATARAKGPRMRPQRPPTHVEVVSGTGSPKPATSSTGGFAAPLRRSKSFQPPSHASRSSGVNAAPPSSRLTQPTKSQQRRKDLTDLTKPSPSSARATPRTPKSARGEGAEGTPKRAMAAAGAGPLDASAIPGSAGRVLSDANRYLPTTPSSRSRPPTYSARVSAHSRTHSPSGRFHPDSGRRLEIRGVDILAGIDYYAPGGAPDNDRSMKEGSWLTSQAFIESLRVYPDASTAAPITMPGEEIAFSGNTASARRKHTEHLETALRRRFSIAPADADWLPEQLPVQWPIVPGDIGKWRSVGNQNAMALPDGAGSADNRGGLFGRLFKGGRVGSPSSRAAAAAVAASSGLGGLVGSSDAGTSRGFTSARSPMSTGRDQLFSR